MVLVQRKFNNSRERTAPGNTFLGAVCFRKMIGAEIA